jgi:DNA-directed RNA polymerase I, II, and III subunit RPABC1
VLKAAKAYAKERVQLFHIRQLQFDITTHRYAVPHRILKEEEKTAMFNKYKISKPEDQLPWIDSQDAMAKWIGAVPGDVIEVIRHSDVAGRVPFYRYCVEDVNVA